jgi:hypothetical protein
MSDGAGQDTPDGAGQDIPRINGSTHPNHFVGPRFLLFSLPLANVLMRIKFE